MTGAKRKQEGVRSIVIHPEIYIFESVDLSAWKRRQHLRLRHASTRRRLRGHGAMLSLQGTIQNTGDPATTIAGHNGGIEQRRTGVICLKGSRESDSLIVVKNRRRTEGRSLKDEVGERRREPGRELVKGKQSQ